MANTNNAVSSDICHPLRPICVFLNVVGAYLYRKQFMNSLLAPPLVTEETQIRYLKAVYEDKHVTSDPLVTYKCDGFTMGKLPYGSMNIPSMTPSSLSSAITFTVSTVSDVFTEGLAFEIGAFSQAMKDFMSAEQMWINHADVSETTQDEKGTVYLATTKISFALAYPIWNTTELEGIFREVRLKVNTQ